MQILTRTFKPLRRGGSKLFLVTLTLLVILQYTNAQLRLVISFYFYFIYLICEDEESGAA